MGKITSLFLAVMLGLTGCGYTSPASLVKQEASEISVCGKEESIPPSTKTSTKLKDTIGYENIKLRKLEELEVKEDEKIQLPTDLENMIKFSTFQTYKNKEKFKQHIYEKYSLSREAVQNMSLFELVKKASEIVADNFEHEHHKNPELEGFIEDGWKERKGDCNMYAEYLGHLFNLLKEDNKKLENAYISDSSSLGKPIAHDWNLIFVLSRDTLQIGMVDSVFYDSGESLDALDELHLRDAWRSGFYASLGDYEEAAKQFPEDVKNLKNIDLSYFFQDYAFNLYLAGKYEKAIKVYEDIGELYLDFKPEALYFQGMSFLNLGNNEKAREKFHKLIKEHPNDFWAGKAREKN